MNPPPVVYLLVALLLFGALYMRFSNGSGSPEIVLQKIQAGATIIDVRSPAEFASGAYPGAKNIPVQVLGPRMNEIPKDKPVVVYCLSGGRSSMAAEMLRGAGYTDVTNGGGLSDMPR